MAVQHLDNQNIKFFTLLRTFTPEEMHKFAKFINSKYNNPNAKAAELYKLLFIKYPYIIKDDFDKEELFKIVFKGRKYNDSTFRNLFSALLELGKRFIATESFLKDKRSYLGHVMDEMNLRGQNDLYLGSLNKLESISGGKIDSGFFTLKHKIAVERFNYDVLNKKLTRLAAANRHVNRMKELETYLLLNTFIGVINDYVNMTVYMQTMNSEWSKSLGEQIFKVFDINRIYKGIKGKSEYDYIIGIYIRLLRAYSHFEKKTNYTDYKKSVEKYSHLLKDEEIAVHYNNLFNYCVMSSNIRQQRKLWREELFNLAEVMLAKKYFRTNSEKYLKNETFRTIALAARRYKSFEWIKNFIDTWSEELAPQHKKGMKNLALAFFYFDMSDYQSCMECLSGINYNKFIYKYDHYSLSLRILYMQQNDTALFDKLNNMRVTLRADKMLNDASIKSRLLFCKYLGKLANYRAGKKRIDLRHFRTQLEQSGNVLNKEWLLEKMDEMIHGIKKAV